MQYLGLAAFNERCNGFVNNRQVDIAVMFISLRSVMVYSTFVWRLSMNVAMVSLTIGRLILRLWVYRYDRLWHGNGFVNDRQVDIAVMGIGISLRSVMACTTLV